MIVPLAMTIYFSFLRYNLLDPDNTFYAGWSNYYYFVTDPISSPETSSTRSRLVLLILVITIVGGVLLALVARPAVLGARESSGCWSSRRSSSCRPCPRWCGRI